MATLEQLLNIDIKDFNKLSKSDLSKIVSQMGQAANKRIKRIESKGTSTPATRRVMETGGKISAQGKSLNELRYEYNRAKTFLQSKTSTISGYKKVRQDISKDLQKAGVRVNEKDLDDFFRIYEDIKAKDPLWSDKAFKYSAFKEIAKLDFDGDIESQLDKLNERLSRIYEEQASLENEFNGVSDFFTE